MTTRAYYFVTDIEADGRNPSENSMLSFATVAVRDDGVFCGEFETVMKPIPGRTTNAETTAWWKTQPEAWAAATDNAQDPGAEMKRFVAWVYAFDGERCFAARPLLFDGMWIDQYLRLFADENIFGVPYWGSTLFAGQALDIQSYAMGVFGRTAIAESRVQLPADWLGDHDHTHRAIDDARGYATLLSRLLKLAADAPDHPSDFFGN